MHKINTSNLFRSKMKSNEKSLQAFQSVTTHHHCSIYSQAKYIVVVSITYRINIFRRRLKEDATMHLWKCISLVIYLSWNVETSDSSTLNIKSFQYIFHWNYLLTLLFSYYYVIILRPWKNFLSMKSQKNSECLFFSKFNFNHFISYHHRILKLNGIPCHYWQQFIIIFFSEMPNARTKRDIWIVMHLNLQIF